MTAGEYWTAGQVGMVRFYALALESVAGVPLKIDPVQGRLYPLAAIGLLEEKRAHLLTHPGLSREAATRAVTEESEASEASRIRLPGVLSSDSDPNSEFWLWPTALQGQGVVLKDV